MPIKNDLILYQKLAQARRGKCLSTEYIGAMSKLKFECEQGHVWETNAVNISGKNRWCPFCAPNKKLSLDDAINFANQFDGYCLSKEYVICTDKLQWKCKYGHEWESSFVSIKNSKGWCPQCTGKFFSENIVRRVFETIFDKKFPKKKPKWLKHNKSFLELDGYCEELGIAFEHQGLQHYVITIFSNTKKQLNKIKLRDSIKKKLCVNNGVKLIIVPDVFSKLGIDNLVDFLLKELDCGFEKSKINIQQIISEERNDSSANRMPEIMEFVAKKGGKCLSKYIGYNIKLKFQCKDGHEWYAKWNNVSFGTWCPICYKNSRGII